MPSHNETDFPNVLVLSGAVPETRFAGSLLLYRLLLGYPDDRVRAVGQRPHPQSELLACRYEYLPPAWSSRLNLTRFATLKRSLEALHLIGRISRTGIDEAVGDFRPDVVVSVMERHDYVAAAHAFCRRRNLPLVLLVHDRLESFELVYPGFRAAQIRSNSRIYRFASARLCVSPEMVDSLERIYGSRGSVLYPNRSDALSPRPIEDSATLKAAPKLTLGYAGTLAYGYGTRIREVTPALAAAQIQLRVYSHDNPGSGFPTNVLWERVKSECDAVWLPYSHDEHFQALYRTHFPSKLVEYMALGMPILITGPAYATGVKWGIGHPNAAMTVPDDTVATVVEAAQRLRIDDMLRVALATESRGGDRDFDPKAIRDQFVQILRDVSRPGGRARMRRDS